MDSKKTNSKLVAAKLVAIAMASQGCGVASYGGDGITITGSPEGIRSYHDGLNGIITNGKASPDAQDTPYYQLRRTQEQLKPLFTGRARMPRVGGQK